MKKERIERLKAALLTVEREELARFEALPEPAVSPDFAERFVARLNEKPEKRPARPFPLRRLIVPVAAALALAFLFIVPVSADGKTLAGVVKDLFVSSSTAPKEIKKIYTLDLPAKYTQRSLTESSTSVLTVWTSPEKRINLYQHLQDDSFSSKLKDTYDIKIVDDQLYYYKFSEENRRFQILWRTDEYDFELIFFNEDDKDVCFAILATLHVGQEFKSGNTTFRFLSTTMGYRITEYLGSGDDLEIPSAHHGLPVTEIGANVFRDCTFLTTIRLPASIQGIQPRAFEGCVNLKDVTILNHARIAEDAFRG
ncbi:MAG: leucine-rich repeat protein, partial [Clostridia bacterium]|nr:leucine-rich repeat protein [Clostridia bacterium]